MKLCFDTCVAIDIAQKNDRFISSFAAFDIALLGQHEVYLPVQAMPTIPYILHRRGMGNRDALCETRVLTQLFHVMDASESDVLRAFECDMPDFEDAIIAQAAARNGIDFIITGNTKDFANSPVRALSPEQFIELFKPHDYIYEWVATTLPQVAPNGGSET